MKFFILFAFVFSAQVFAGNTITCTNPANSKLHYVLQELDYDHYSFTVTKQVLVQDSCRTRWGCDYNEEVIVSDKVRFTDFQGAGVFKSKRTYITMEDMDEVEYSYTTKNALGVFVSKTDTLKCQ